jgi:hypothetical protein
VSPLGHTVSGQTSINFILLYFKLSPCSECCILSLSDSLASEFYMLTFRNTICSTLIGGVSTTPMKMCSETSAYKIHTPGNHPKETIQLYHYDNLTPDPEWQSNPLNRRGDTFPFPKNIIFNWNLYKPRQLLESYCVMVMFSLITSFERLTRHSKTVSPAG